MERHRRGELKRREQGEDEGGQEKRMRVDGGEMNTSSFNEGKKGEG